jgi:pimeloyl-ACP methyl ester carboxylesterase
MCFDFISLRRALLFNYGLFRYREKPPVQIEETALTYPGLEGESVPARQYQPKRKPIGSMIIYPGASPYAEEHPAMKNLARSLARTGFFVFTPRIPPLKQLHINEEELLKWMGHIYQWVTNIPHVDSNTISLIGLSFGGALVLQAVLQPEFKNPAPRSILVYGTYYNLQEALEFLVSGEFVVEGKQIRINPDRWGLVVFLYNYLPKVDVGYSTSRLQALLNYAVQPNVTLQLEDLKDLSPQEEELALGLFFSQSTAELKRVMNCIYDQYRDEFEARSPKSWCHRVTHRVYVVHGSRDTMCPYTESIKLAQQLPNSSLLISHLHEHREMTTGHGIFFMTREIGKLVRYLYFLFKEHAR